MRRAEAGPIDVLWTPSELPALAPGDRPAVVVDVIRATTTILVALEAGAREVVPAASEEEAVRLASPERSDGALLCGERGGRRIPGFDLGNSPREYTPERVAGERLVFRTTNGTGAIRAAASAGRVYLASFRNVGAVADRLRRDGAAPVVVCAGRDGRVGLDDVLCAGMLVERWAADAGAGLRLPDGARAARSLARSAGPVGPGLLERTDAGRALASVELEGDLESCAAVDASRGVPVLRDGRVVLATGGEHGD